MSAPAAHPGARELLQQASTRQARGEFRAAELLLREAMAAGAQGAAPRINLGHSLLAQSRWWEGGSTFYYALRGLPDGGRLQAMAQVTAMLTQWSQHLASQGLSADSADCRALLDSLSPFPEGPVCFAARWVSTLSPLNLTEVLRGFAREARKSDLSSDPLNQDDLRALLHATRRGSDPAGSLLRIYEALMMHLTHAGVEPDGWYEPAARLLQERSGRPRLAVCAGLALQNALSRHPDSRLQEGFLALLEQAEAGSDAAKATAAYRGLLERLHPAASRGGTGK